MGTFNNTAEAVRRILEERTITRELTDVALCSVPVFIVIINVAILTAFVVQKLRCSTVKVSPPGLLVLNLLFADTFIGVVFFVDIIFFSNKIVAYPSWCNVRMGFIYLAGVGSHCALINVVIDRFVAIVYTFQHRDWVTFTRSVVMVSCGWLIPIIGGIAAFATIDGHPGLVRCADISTYRTFLMYVLVPSTAIASLCIVTIQCRVYLCLRRHGWNGEVASYLTRRSSDRAARILYRVATPTCIAMISYDVMLIIITMSVNQVVLHLYHSALLLLLLSFLFNPVVYSYATANIRKPVSELCSDIKKWLQLGVPSARSGSGSTPSQGVFIVRREGSSQTSSSTLSDLAP